MANRSRRHAMTYREWSTAFHTIVFMTFRTMLSGIPSYSQFSSLSLYSDHFSLCNHKGKALLQKQERQWKHSTEAFLLT